MRTAHTALLAAAFVVACGGDGTPDKPTAESYPLVLDEAPGGRTVVAKVNGRPIYDDCVRHQLAGGTPTKRAALDECIDFELLAQEAQRKGFQEHPAVYQARKREVARAYMNQNFAPTFDSPADVPESELRAAYNKLHDRFHHGEYRFTVYVRADVAQKLPRGSPEDLAAQKAAEAMYEALKDKRELTKDQFKDIAIKAAGGAKLSMDMRTFDFPLRGRAVPEFADAAFAIPEVGMVSKPVRTKWGWDVILLVRILPGVDKSFDEAKAELAQGIFEGSRRRAFLRWSHQQAKGKEVLVDQELLATLDAPVWMTKGKKAQPAAPEK